MGKHDVDNVTSRNVPGIAEDVSGYVWLELVAACTAVVTAEMLLRWSTATRGAASAGE